MKRIVDIYINFVKQSSLSYIFKQMDTTELHCFFNGDVNLKNKKVNIFWKTPEKAIIQQEANSIDPTKNIAVIQLLDDCVSHVGKVEFEIELLDENDKIISTFKSFGVIAASIKGDVSASNSETYYQTIENELSKLEQKTNEIYSNENQRILNESSRVIAEEERKQLAETMRADVEATEELIDTVETKLENGDFNGQNGYTPVRGVDYWTNADKQEIINSVILQIQDGEEVDY